MTRARRIYITLLCAAGIIAATPAGAFAIEVNKDFKPQNEFKLEPWVPIHLGGIDLSINKAVFMLFLASAATILLLTLVARRMQAKPNKTQAAVELAYEMVAKTIVKDNIEKERYARRWFPFLAALFFFVLFNNLLGFLPLPIDSVHTIDIFGVGIPQLGIYAATANISVPLALALVVWVSYNVEGVRENGPIKYVKSWIPEGVPGPVKPFLFLIEAISHMVRLISLSVRLFANMLAGHILILIMSAGMVILLGTVLVAPLTLPLAFAFYVFEVVLVASLQAFIFSILSSIYIGEAVAGGH